MSTSVLLRYLPDEFPILPICVLTGVPHAEVAWSVVRSKFLGLSDFEISQGSKFSGSLFSALLSPGKNTISFTAAKQAMLHGHNGHWQQVLLCDIWWAASGALKEATGEKATIPLAG
jgi:hypothetical protein